MYCMYGKIDFTSKSVLTACASELEDDPTHAIKVKRFIMYFYTFYHKLAWHLESRFYSCLTSKLLYRLNIDALA